MTKRRFRGYIGLGVLAAVGLSGCSAAGKPVSSHSASPKPTHTTKQVRTVRLEILGKGKAMQPIVFMADEDGTEHDVKLPWSKTAKIELTDAEQRVGRIVSVVAGSVRGADGQLKPAACRIVVDGEPVVNAKGMCEFKIK